METIIKLGNIELSANQHAHLIAALVRWEYLMDKQFQNAVDAHANESCIAECKENLKNTRILFSKVKEYSQYYIKGEFEGKDFVEEI